MHRAAALGLCAALLVLLACGRRTAATSNAEEAGAQPAELASAPALGEGGAADTTQNAPCVFESLDLFVAAWNEQVAQQEQPNLRLETRIAAEPGTFLAEINPWIAVLGYLGADGRVLKISILSLANAPDRMLAFKALDVLLGAYDPALRPRRNELLQAAGFPSRGAGEAERSRTHLRFDSERGSGNLSLTVIRAPNDVPR